jgi:hypothetical protein
MTLCAINTIETIDNLLKKLKGGKKSEMEVLDYLYTDKKNRKNISVYEPLIRKHFAYYSLALNQYGFENQKNLKEYFSCLFGEECNLCDLISYNNKYCCVCNKLSAHCKIICKTDLCVDCTQVMYSNRSENYYAQGYICCLCYKEYKTNEIEISNRQLPKVIEHIINDYIFPCKYTWKSIFDE